jgi:hypothetical protein
MAKHVSVSLIKSLTICGALLLLSSCRRSDRETDPDAKSSYDLSLALSSWNDVFRQVDMFTCAVPDMNTNPGWGAITNCATLTESPAPPSTAFPKTLTIDFGVNDCKGPDGTSRRGQILVTVSGNYRDSLTRISIVTHNYYFNDYAVSGTCTISNNGRNAKGNPVFSQQIISGNTKYTNNRSVTWNASFTRERTAGDTTATVFDDEYLLSGTASGQSSNGDPFLVYINVPLKFTMSCPWIESGNLYLDPDALPNRFIDFGNGSCNGKATIWIFGNSYPLYQY